MIARRLLAVTLLSGLAVFGFVSPASAAVPTTITFAQTEVTAAFGSDWQLSVAVTVSNDFGKAPIQPSDGSVDILIDGMPGEYVTAAAIVPGGTAYFVQPANEPPLAAGTYDVTARFTPAAGSGLSESATKKVAKLTIEPLTVVPTIEVISDPAITATPIVRTSLAGTYLDTVGVPPSGVWTVTAVDSDGEQGFEGTATQPTQGVDGAAVGPLDIPIDGALKPGETYTVTTVFTPDELIAGGIALEESTPATFTTKAATAGEVLTAPVGVPIAVTVLLVLLILGLTGLAVWLIVLWRRARLVAEPEEEPAPTQLIAIPATEALPPAGPPVLTPEDPYLPALPSYPLSMPGAPGVPEKPAGPVSPVAPATPFPPARPTSTPPTPPAPEPTSWSLSDLGLGDDPEDPDESTR